MRLRVIFTIGFALGVSTLYGGLAAQGQYAKVGEIQVGGAGRWDYLTIDSAGKRLYVSHGTEVVVIDTSTDKVVGRIADTPGVHGMAIVPALNRGFTTNGGENKVGIVDLKTLQTLSKVDTGANPDAIVYEPTQKEIYALNHTGHSVTAFDAATGKITATIPLAGTAETGQADPGLGRVFVNIEDKDSVDVIDIAKHEVIANWPVAPAESPTGMAIDPPSHRLFVGGGKALVMIDDTSGKVVANVPICSGTDATFFDPATKLVFVSCSDGHVTIAHMDSPDKLSVVQTLATSPRSRTMALDPATHKIYLSAVKLPPPDPNAPPPVAGQRGRGPAPVADSFHVLVFGPRTNTDKH
jgi:DNA-binding beta-propeller fold protein YncE